MFQELEDLRYKEWLDKLGLLSLECRTFIADTKVYSGQWSFGQCTDIKGLEG